MIRRVSKNCDLRDYIKSCPSGVVDDIYKIEYYIQGHNVVIDCSFTKVGDTLDVVIPTSQLQLLPNGILMRRCFYKVVDTSYPDGYYNLEFEDNMNIWLGENESEEPVIPEYVTEDELGSTLSSYATQEWVQGQDYLTASTLPSDIATEQFVTVKIGELRGLTNESINALNSAIYDLSMMTRASFSLIGATLSQMREDFATKVWVAEQSFATYSYVNSAVGEVSELFRAETYDIRYEMSSMTESISALNDAVFYVSETCSELGVEINEIMTTMATSEDIDGVYSYIDEQGYATEQFVTDSLSEYATQEWVSEQGYITVGELPSGLATQSWVQSQGYLTSVPEGYATQSWVESQSFLTSASISTYVTESVIESMGFATESWVQSQGYLTSVPSEYATQSWVSSNFLSSVPSDYATKSWVSSNYFEESKIWVGSYAAWLQMTSEQQAFYTIALIKE